MFDQPSYNSRQPQTGHNGCLPDTEYNLHCPANGGPEWKLNYFKASCAIRLEDHTCKTGDCPRFVGEKPKKVVQPVIVKKEGRPKTNTAPECRCCGEDKKLKAFDLCKSCYGLNRYYKTIDHWRNLGATRAEA